jgi:hypothetical protein
VRSRGEGGGEGEIGQALSSPTRRKDPEETGHGGRSEILAVEGVRLSEKEAQAHHH